MGAKKLKVFLKANKITQEHLAEGVNVSDGMIGHIISGKRKASLELATKISEFLAIPIDTIFDPENITNYYVLERDILSESTSKDNLEFKIFRTQIDYTPQCFTLGTETIFSIIKKSIPNTYQIYELDNGLEKIKIMRRTKKEGFETYLIPDDPTAKTYKLSDYSYQFIGSLINIKVIY